MTDINLPVTPPIFGPDFCFTPQGYANELAAGLVVTLPGTIGLWTIGPNAPGVNFRDRPWKKIDPNTGITIGDFDWSPLFAKWLKLHFQLGSPSYQFVPSTTNLDTFDGGESGPVTPIAGPFWKLYVPPPNVTPPAGTIYITRTTRLYDRAL